MGYGLWVMGYGLWVMGYGLWVNNEIKSERVFKAPFRSMTHYLMR